MLKKYVRVDLMRTLVEGSPDARSALWRRHTLEAAPAVGAFWCGQEILHFSGVLRVLVWSFLGLVVDTSTVFAPSSNLHTVSMRHSSPLLINLLPGEDRAAFSCLDHSGTATRAPRRSPGEIAVTPILWN